MQMSVIRSSASAGIMLVLLHAVIENKFDLKSNTLVVGSF